MNASETLFSIIKHYEGCRLSAYLDSNNIPTIGYGNTIYPNGNRVKIGDTITQSEADNLLNVIASNHIASVNRALNGLQLPQNKFDALCDLEYNIGIGHFESSTLLRKLLINQNDATINSCFLAWDIAGGEISAGLLARRKTESELYFNNKLVFFN